VSDDLLKRLALLEADSRTITRHLERLGAQLSGQEAKYDAISTVCTSIASLVAQQGQLLSAAHQAEAQTLRESIAASEQLQRQLQHQLQQQHQLHLSITALADRHLALQAAGAPPPPAAALLAAGWHHQAEHEAGAEASTADELPSRRRSYPSQSSAHTAAAPVMQQPQQQPQQQPAVAVKQAKITAMPGNQQASPQIATGSKSPLLLSASASPAATLPPATDAKKSGAPARSAAAPGQWQSRRRSSADDKPAAVQLSQRAPAAAVSRPAPVPASSKPHQRSQSVSPAGGKAFIRRSAAPGHSSAPAAPLRTELKLTASVALQPAAVRPVAAVGGKRSASAAEMPSPQHQPAPANRQRAAAAAPKQQRRSRPLASGAHFSDDEDIAAQVAARMSRHRARRAHKRASQSQSQPQPQL
jgi:hypothetical protein